MKKVFLTPIIMVAGILAISFSIPAEEQLTEAITEEMSKALVVFDMNIREQDNESSPVIGVVSEGTIVNVISSEKYWTHISYSVSDDMLLEGYIRTEALDFENIDFEEVDIETDTEAETETETELSPLSMADARAQFKYDREYEIVENSIREAIVGSTDCSVRELVLATVKMDPECMKKDYDGDAFRFLIKGNYTLDDEYGMFKEQKRFDAVYAIGIYSRNRTLEEFKTVD